MPSKHCSRISGVSSSSANDLAAWVLPTPGLALEQQRLRQPHGAEQRRRQTLVGQVADLGEPVGQASPGPGRDRRGSRPRVLRGVGEEALDGSRRSRSRRARRRRRRTARRRRRRPSCRTPGRRRPAGSRLPAPPDRRLGRRGARARDRSAMIWARTDRAISPAVRAPMSRPAGVWMRAFSSSVRSRESEHRATALRAGDQPDVRHAGAHGRGRASPPRPCRGTRRPRHRPRPGRSALNNSRLVAERRRDLAHGPRDRALPEHADQRRGKDRLEEDLQRASRQAGVVDDGLAGLVGLGVRDDPQQHRVAGLQQRQPLRADGRLGALTADEALDAAVGAARAPRRRAWPTSASRPGPPGRARTGRGSSAATRPVRAASVWSSWLPCYSTAMSVRTGRPWIARHTFAGVSGMSA